MDSSLCVRKWGFPFVHFALVLKKCSYISCHVYKGRHIQTSTFHSLIFFKTRYGQHLFGCHVRHFGKYRKEKDGCEKNVTSSKKCRTMNSLFQRWKPKAKISVYLKMLCLSDTISSWHELYFDCAFLLLSIVKMFALLAIRAEKD